MFYELCCVIYDEYRSLEARVLAAIKTYAPAVHATLSFIELYHISVRIINYFSLRTRSVNINEDERC